MQVKAIFALQGLDATTAPGEVVDLPDSEAEALLKIGAAEKVETPKPSKQKNGKAGE